VGRSHTSLLIRQEKIPHARAAISLPLMKIPEGPGKGFFRPVPIAGCCPIAGPFPSFA
jgi:hypothetical protein